VLLKRNDTQEVVDGYKLYNQIERALVLAIYVYKKFMRYSNAMPVQKGKANGLITFYSLFNKT
jgi:hypothetical protein